MKKIFGILLVVLLAGCATSAQQVAIPPEKGVKVLEIHPVFSTVHSGLMERVREVIRNETEWRKMWSRIMSNRTPRPAPPEIDFSHSMVIVASMGQRKTGGYTIEITGVRSKDERLLATIVEKSPAPRCIVTQAFTSPVAVVQLAKIDQPVEFEERTKINPCE